MLFHTQFVLAALTGWRLDWKSPPREDASTSWRQAWARHGAHTVLAVAWIAAIVFTSDAFPWWLSPILAGLLFAIPLSVSTSRATLGRSLKKRGLLLTPEETRVPQVLRSAERLAAEVEAKAANFVRAIADDATHARVVAAAPGRQPRAGAKLDIEAALVERALREGPASLGADDRLRILSSPSASQRLHREVLGHHAHPDWWRELRIRPGGAPARAAEAVHATSLPVVSRPVVATEPL